MQKTIRFIIDSVVTEVDLRKYPGLRPTTTLLQWLRMQSGHKGVKEGCGEGDCGACTIVLAEPSSEGKMVYKAVDSCLVFLPMVHGKQVITIEDLAQRHHPDHPDRDDRNDRNDRNDRHDRLDRHDLHPVQQALVEMNGIQCGYCTPGMVMSLFALYKNHRNPSRETIGDALAGNLCRCTGYLPIINAAEEVCRDPQPDQFSGEEGKILGLLRNIRTSDETIHLTGEGQSYFKPFTLKEALRLRKENPTAIIINGSTDVSLRQTKKRERLRKIIDLSAVTELSFIRKEDCRIVTGAGTSLESVSRFTKESLPALHSILKVFGSLQIRNLATIGGNIGSASPIGDTLPLLLALGTELKLSSPKSSRIITLEKFIKGYRRTTIAKDELITEVHIPLPAPDEKISSFKVSRRKDLDISTVSAAFRIRLEGNVVADAALVFGGMDAIPRHAWITENFLKGKSWEPETVDEAMKTIESEFEPISDARAGAEFRRNVAANLLMKFYLETRPV